MYKEPAKKQKYEEVVVAQLIDRSLPTPEVRGSIPVMGKIYIYFQVYLTVKIKKKSPQMAQCFFKKETTKKEKYMGTFSRREQCDQIGRFLKVLDDKVVIKSSPNVW